MDTKTVKIDCTGVTVFLTIILALGKTVGGWDIGWLWVFLPLWLPYAMVAIVILLMGIGAFLGIGGIVIAAMFDKFKK